MRCYVPIATIMHCSKSSVGSLYRRAASALTVAVPRHQSSLGREHLLDLIHQRMCQARFAQLGEVFQDDSLPGLIVRYLFGAAVFQIKRSRFIRAI
jgi:hypothetical protein